MLDWTLHLSDQIPIELAVETSTGRSTLELGALQITVLKINANTSETQISLPDREGHATVHIEVKTAYVTIHVPPDVAAYIHGDRDPAADEIDLARFPMIKGKHEYRSKRSKTASKRVDIRIDGTMSPVQIL